MQTKEGSARSLSKVDRNLAIPLGQQIRAHLIHAISSGRLAIGSPLPSVRDMAEALGVAPATVAKTYTEMKAEGLLEAQVGSGTYVAHSRLARLGADRRVSAIAAGVDVLVDRLRTAGLDASDISAILNARTIHRLAEAARPRVFMVGLFEAATLSYAARLTEQLGDGAMVSALVLAPDDPEAERSAAEALQSADLIVTFASLRDRLGRIAPNRPVVAVRFIPAETTRMALAAVRPMTRMVVVSRFADFLPVLELGVRRFAPHVQDVTALDIDASDLAAHVARCDVLVFSTGAESAADLAPAEATRIEYLHMPDPGDVETAVRPHILPGGENPPRTEPIQTSKEAS
ncbi:GntR family transcriptional regulator [Tropicimonas sp. IMCC34043]|uniref:GntR family transcriptional regulator n=1 Tax=Tropicimonas sp. IMCC34043 TaxID=2248760 RepID=UPI000E24F5A9|nr:GntR family transcriptional regulator [Tropicimonas sp. IMCC34043]